MHSCEGQPLPVRTCPLPVRTCRKCDSNVGACDREWRVARTFRVASAHDQAAATSSQVIGGRIVDDARELSATDHAARIAAREIVRVNPTAREGARDDDTGGVSELSGHADGNSRGVCGDQASYAEAVEGDSGAAVGCRTAAHAH